MSMIKPCVYCGSPVSITTQEEKSFQAHGINLLTLRVACASCDYKKIQPLIAEDG
jgi:hypothetical protein